MIKFNLARMNPDTVDNTNFTMDIKSILSEEKYRIGAKICYTATFVVSLLGVITNAINIRVFMNQGLSGNSSAVSLFFLAITDLGACATLVPMFTCTILDFMGNLPGLWSCVAIVELPGPYAHAVFYRLSSWITGYLTLERGFSVILPLKVKFVFKPKVTRIILSIMTVVIILAHCAYPLGLFEWIYDPVWNVSRAMSVPNEIYENSLVIQSYVFELVSPCLILSFVIPSLIIIIITLRRSNEFRGKSLNSSHSALDKESKRKMKESEIMKAIAIVWGVYIVCQTFNFVPAIASSTLDQDEFFHGIASLLYIAKFLVDNINASTNILIYMTVSSSYKTAFQRVFCKTRSKQNDLASHEGISCNAMPCDLPS